MSVLEYIEETNPTEVRELLTATHHFLQENLPPFAACAVKWKIPFYSLRRNFCYLNRHRDHITLGFPHDHRLAPPPVPTQHTGRALTPKEVRHLLASPDKTKPEGARDYALLLVMLRLSLRLSEVCSLRRSSITATQGRWVLKCKVNRGQGRGLAAAGGREGGDRRLCPA